MKFINADPLITGFFVSVTVVPLTDSTSVLSRSLPGPVLRPDNVTAIPGSMFVASLTTTSLEVTSSITDLSVISLGVK